MKNMENRKNISGNFIKDSRIKIGISQETLAGKLNLFGLRIDQSAISRIENGTRELYDYELYCICKILKVDINLFFDKDLIAKIPKKHNPFIKK
ncbi:helix-turn-helix domain-containing protein [Clostridium chromiireducens]|uniref:Helix-turn-helix domain-containing protein n=2 Tax=Clostridium chromiireducens TaxID=225345 RepID=A0A964RIW2_9CLOT|nr:helix-turn-helix domain-containing protein [Clostridium chromiireducens]